MTPEEQDALDEYLRLTPDEKRALADFARFANRPSKADDQVPNLEHLKDLVRKRPKLISILRRAELWDEARRLLVMLGGLAGAIVAVLALYKALVDAGVMK